MPKSYDELQDDVSVLVRDFLRRELSKDYYHGKVQALVVLTNSVTGKVNIDTCAVELMADAKKMLREAYDQLDRTQMRNALTNLLADIVKVSAKRRKK